MFLMLRLMLFATPATIGFLLLESGEYLLLEDGNKLVLG